MESEQSSGRLLYVMKGHCDMLQIPPIAPSQIDYQSKLLVPSIESHFPWVPLVPVASGLCYQWEMALARPQTWAEPSAAFLGRQQVTAEEIDA